VPAALREQDATVGLSVPFRKVRHTQAWQAAFNAGTDTLSSRAASVRTRRPAVRGAWAIATGKQYGWSISTEDGVAASLTTEQVRAALGADGDADAFTGQVRAYWRPGRGHAVLAARAGYGASSGDASVRRRFFLGGATPAGPLVDFGGDAFRMLRGFDSAVSFGDRIAVASVEWRQPILRLERGWGTFPALVRSIHGAVFLDAGQTWDRGFRLSDTKTSVGAEAAVDLVAGYWFRLTLTVGAAWAHDPAPAGISGGAFYVRTGPSF
jgi:outer membrane protein assembly factor BamA